MPFDSKVLSIVIIIIDGEAILKSRGGQWRGYLGGERQHWVSHWDTRETRLCIIPVSSSSASSSASSSLFQHHHPCSQSKKSVSVNDYPIGSRIRDYWWQWKWRRRCQAKDHELIGKREISREWDEDQNVINDYPRHSLDPEFSNTCGYKRRSGNFSLLALIPKQLEDFSTSS